MILVFMLAFAIMSRPVMLVRGQTIKFTSNENIQEKHKEAHYAPRSQKYWDEHNIERPDYAKTDAEIMAEKRERIGSSKLLSFALISAISFLIFFVYAFATDNIEMITNGIRGHRLGTSTEKQRISERESRLKRFENPKDMLDNMKAD